MNKLRITKVSIRPNNTGKLPHLQSKQRRGVRNYYTTNMMQALTYNKTKKHKINNLIKYTAQEHTGYVTTMVTTRSPISYYRIIQMKISDNYI